MIWLSRLYKSLIIIIIITKYCFQFNFCLYVNQTFQKYNLRVIYQEDLYGEYKMSRSPTIKHSIVWIAYETIKCNNIIILTCWNNTTLQQWQFNSIKWIFSIVFILCILHNGVLVILVISQCKLQKFKHSIVTLYL